MRRIIGIFIIAITLSSCDEPTDAVIEGHIRETWSQISDKDYVRVRGIGVVPDKIEGITRRRGISRNAALVGARYEMLALVKGVRITGGLTIGRLMQKDGRIKEIAERIIRGAEEIKSEWTSDDGCIVTLQLHRDKIARMIVEDEKHEPIPLRRRQELDAARLYSNDVIPRGMRRVRYGKNPKTALTLGLMFPGLGQVYAGEAGEREVGYYTMTATLVLVSGGFYYSHDRPTGGQKSDGTQNTVGPSKPIAYTFFGLAGLLHVWSALDGTKTAHANGSWYLRPEKKGLSFGLTRRF